MGKMKAVILAAGYGSRLRPLTNEIPKLLVPLGGVPLIERNVLSAKEAGIKEFLVVLGYLGDRLKEELGDGKKHGVKIEYVENREWERANGVSVYKTRKVLKENFILLMGDHIFDPRTLSVFKDYEIGAKECALCVDYNIGRIFDKDGATKAWVKDGRIRRIGKDLKRYNAIDTGMFLCSPYLFKVLEENIKKGRYSLSESIQTLAEQGLMEAYDIKESFWCDLDTKEDFEMAESILQDL
ncbi:MAG: phosphocholine cytidylyltransferase family protein [Candidatus Hydrothermarchaeales archaeon]